MGIAHLICSNNASQSIVGVLPFCGRRLNQVVHALATNCLQMYTTPEASKVVSGSSTSYEATTLLVPFLAEVAMSESPDTGDQSEESSWIVLRSAETLMELPLAIRWEVTRRHPYYLMFWEMAHRCHQQESANPPQRAQDEAARLLLQGIGFSMDPPPPGADWASLGGTQLGQAWQQALSHQSPCVAWLACY